MVALGLAMPWSRGGPGDPSLVDVLKARVYGDVEDGEDDNEDVDTDFSFLINDDEDE